MKKFPGQIEQLDGYGILTEQLDKITGKASFSLSDKPYNLTVSHEKKFIWFRVAKVGTRTILHHLKRNGVMLDVEHASSVHYSPAHFRDYFKFAFVRNPWDRLVSCWTNKVLNSNHFKFDAREYQRMKHFPHFMDFVSSLDIEKCDRHLSLQSTLIDLNNIDFLGRIERFDDDIATVSLRLDIPNKKMARQNTTPGRKPYREYYDDMLSNRAYNIYRKDIQIFGYEF